MAAVALAPPTKETPLLFKQLTWREFKAVEQLLDQPGYRLSYLDGTLEILQMPGEPHETAKKRIAALLELYLLLAGFDFVPTGSMTLESEVSRVKREADESYKLRTSSSRPDLVIEVTVSSGGIDKLEAYKRLKISEVWFWEDGVLDLYHLRAGSVSSVENGDAQPYYEKIEVSEEVEGIDLALLSRCILMANHVEALKAFQTGMAASG